MVIYFGQTQVPQSPLPCLAEQLCRLRLCSNQTPLATIPIDAHLILIWYPNMYSRIRSNLPEHVLNSPKSPKAQRCVERCQKTHTFRHPNQPRITSSNLVQLFRLQSVEPLPCSVGEFYHFFVVKSYLFFVKSTVPFGNVKSQCYLEKETHISADDIYMSFIMLLWPWSYPRYPQVVLVRSLFEVPESPAWPGGPH